MTDLAATTPPAPHPESLTAALARVSQTSW